MAEKNTIYLTTTLPYVNADPHIGFALEVVQADIFARHHSLLGKDVFFNTGTDEHGLKIYRKAQESGKDTQEYVNEYAEKFKNLGPLLGLSSGIHFIRTTDSLHKKATQEFWERCNKNGDIYKKPYKIKYCVGCELEKTDSELVDGKCSIHQHMEIESIEEENYFFRFSKYQKPLLKLYEERPDFVLPDSRFNEIKTFVSDGLEDFSISRLKEKMPWGVPVPNDENHVMYVWFDALINYISTIGWPHDMDLFNKWWPVLQFAGKDQVRQQTAMWQAMLLSAGLEPSKKIVIHGFITSEGRKMSKSLGNVINPVALVDEYGTDALRYYLARHVHPFEDSDFTMGRFKDAYNANLANGLGNTVARVMKMAELHLKTPILLKEGDEKPDDRVFIKNMESFEIQKAMDVVWKRIGDIDRFIQEEEPFKKIKSEPEKAKEDIGKAVRDLLSVAVYLEPFMPETASKIKDAVRENKMPPTLFRRKE